jgi:hypothetical protein
MKLGRRFSEAVVLTGFAFVIACLMSGCDSNEPASYKPVNPQILNKLNKANQATRQVESENKPVSKKKR